MTETPTAENETKAKTPRAKAAAKPKPAVKAKPAPKPKPAKPQPPVLPGPGDPPGEWLEGASGLAHLRLAPAGARLEVAAPFAYTLFAFGSGEEYRHATWLIETPSPTGELLFDRWQEKPLKELGATRFRLLPPHPAGHTIFRPGSEHEFEHARVLSSKWDGNKHVKTWRKKLCRQCGRTTVDHVLYLLAFELEKSHWRLGYNLEGAPLCRSCAGLPCVLHRCYLCGQEGSQTDDYAPLSPLGLMPTDDRASEKAAKPPARKLPREVKREVEAKGGWYHPPDRKLPLGPAFDGPVACLECQWKAWRGRHPETRTVEVTLPLGRGKSKAVTGGQLGLNTDLLGYAQEAGLVPTPPPLEKFEPVLRAQGARRKAQGAKPETAAGAEPVKRGRGRPAGSKNKPKDDVADVAPEPCPLNPDPSPEEAPGA